MESAAALRSFHHSVGIALHARGLLEKPRIIRLSNSNWCIPSTPYTQCLVVGGNINSSNNPSTPYTQCLVVGGNINSSNKKRNVTQICCANSPEATAAEKSVSPETNASTEKKPSRIATFPNGFEDLMLDICDGTEIAEVKMKIGDFEMHLKRNIGATKAPLSTISPTTPPPIPTEPMIKAALASPPPPPTSTEKVNPFTNVSFGKSSRLAALDASGINNYVLVTSPTVGTFQRSRTVKGKKLPPGFKEGDLIKEGQVIGYLDQFGTELPVRSDVAGEVLKLLVDDGDAVGYGNPLIAVLPSFHGINNVM